jgi:CRISPR system Cascade subunit CasC
MIELHILQSFPVTCLNRDDVGAPKTAYFGGCQRARVSSQSWKRVIRAQAKEFSASFFSGQRTRYVIRSLKDAFKKKGVDDDKAGSLASITADAVGKLDDPEKGNVKTLLFFSPMEIEAVADTMLSMDYEELLEKVIKDTEADKKAQKDKDKASKELKKMASKAAKALSKKVKDAADISLFGRMVADDHSLMVEGAGLFSHALSTHGVSNEIDFFSAVDEEKPEDSEGAGHIGTLEFSSACYYRYVGLNMDLLKDEAHLGHFNEEERKKVVETFLRASIMAVPEARKNSMFGINPPEHVLGLNRTGQPLSLVNAFEKPVRSKDGYVSQSIEALNAKWTALETTYCLKDHVKKQVEMPEKNLNAFINELTGEL